MGSVEELTLVVNQLKAQVLQLTRENELLRTQRQVATATGASDIPDEGVSRTAPTLSKKDKTNPKEPKPPPIFVNGITNISTFDKLLEDNGLQESERKALSNNEVKVFPKTADAYRKLRTILDKTSDDSTTAKLGQLKYHTYQLKCDRPYVVYIHP
jgi:N-acetylneuraminic acid mutarotase